jgi:hypothetical protein
MSGRKTNCIMTLTIVLASLIAVAAGVVMNSAFAQTQKFTASLSGNQEVPPNSSTAKGWAWFKPTGDKLGYQINATGLDKVSMAHIHGAKAGANGDPIAMLKVKQTSGPVNGTLAEGNITSSDLMGSLAGKSVSDLVSKMQSGETYVNVHTDANPNGEIRGQIQMANATK